MSYAISLNLNNIVRVFDRKTYKEEVKEMKFVTYPYSIKYQLVTNRKNQIYQLDNNMVLKTLRIKDRKKEEQAVQILYRMPEANFFIPEYITYNNLFIVMKQTDTDLFTFIRELADNDEELSIDEITLIFAQICRAIYLLNNEYNCTYFDIKTENIGINVNTLKIYFLDLNSINTDYHTVTCLNYIFAKKEEKMLYPLGLVLLELLSTNEKFEEVLMIYWSELKSTNNKFPQEVILEIFTIIIETAEFLFGDTAPELVFIIKQIFVREMKYSIKELYDLVVEEMIVSNLSKKTCLKKNKIRKKLKLNKIKPRKNYLCCFSF